MAAEAIPAVLNGESGASARAKINQAASVASVNAYILETIGTPFEFSIAAGADPPEAAVVFSPAFADPPTDLPPRIDLFDILESNSIDAVVKGGTMTENGCTVELTAIPDNNMLGTIWIRTPLASR